MAAIAIGAVPVHGFVGIWGTLSIGLFASGDFGIPGPDGADTTTTIEGLLYGGGTDQLLAQIIGSLTVVVAVSIAGAALMYGVKATKTLRVEEDGELEGLDIFEHGTPAYHMEFGQGMTYSAPLGKPLVLSSEDADPDGGDDDVDSPSKVETSA